MSNPSSVTPDRYLADYAMAFDLIGSLTGVMTEAKVIENILELFVLLCAPDHLAYLPYQDNEPQPLHPHSHIASDDTSVQQRLAAFQGAHGWTESGTGFKLRISRQAETLGIIEVDGIAFPEQRNHYLNLSLSIVPVFSLAITNARMYQRLEQTITDLKASLAQGKQMEIQLQQYAQALETRNEELDTFAHTVAHDLRNPLTSVIWAADLAKQTYGDLLQGDLDKYLGIIHRSGRKMKNIIEELLLLAGVRKATPEMRSLDMSQIIAEVQIHLTSLINQHQAEIVLPESWPSALGYAPWVEEVWANYISNGIKYGGRPPRLELGATPLAEGGVRFWVRDNGPGLTPQEQERLFQPFIRLNQIHVQGQGLGLSIVRQIMEKLGGQVGVESDGIPGEGSAFYFTLPVVPAEHLAADG